MLGQCQAVSREGGRAQSHKGFSGLEEIPSAHALGCQPGHRKGVLAWLSLVGRQTSLCLRTKEAPLGEHRACPPQPEPCPTCPPRAAPGLTPPRYLSVPADPQLLGGIEASLGTRNVASPVSQDRLWPGPAQGPGLQAGGGNKCPHHSRVTWPARVSPQAGEDYKSHQPLGQMPPGNHGFREIQGPEVRRQHPTFHAS